MQMFATSLPDIFSLGPASAVCRMPFLRVCSSSFDSELVVHPLRVQFID